MMGNHEQMAVIHNLLDNRRVIARNVTDEPWGATTVTTSTDSQVTDWIRTHVEQMIALAENNGRIRQCDPLFDAIFDNHDDVSCAVRYLLPCSFFSRSIHYPFSRSLLNFSFVLLTNDCLDHAHAHSSGRRHPSHKRRTHSLRDRISPVSCRCG